MKKLLLILLSLSIVVGIMPTVVFAEVNTDDVIILYENDVHCSIEGYSKLSALKKNLKQSYQNVGVVSSGDYVQGKSVGIISKGEFVVNIMNLVGYDAVTLGNHEFDYGIERLNQLSGMMNTKPVSCNFEKIGDGEPYFEPYSIVEYGDVKIAYVGITTPSTISSSSPAQFRDENGDYIYTFHPEDLDTVVQNAVDSAISEGVDYVIALSHIGDAEPDYSVEDLIGATNGIDVFLDGHSHSVINGKNVKNSLGEDVILTSTGSEFKNIGKLTISDSGITAQLIDTETLTDTDPVIDVYIDEIEETQNEFGGRQVGTSKVDLITHDESGKRLVRNGETNLGNLCSDAFRIFMDADIGFCNGGGIRAPIKSGKVTLNDLLNVLQFNNRIVLVEVSGQLIKDMLELATKDYPAEDGTFPHLSGITFSLNTAIDSSVILDETEMFVKVDGPYRVYDVKVLDRESGEYRPLVLTDSYKLSAPCHYVLDYGGGMKMFENATILRNDGILDIEVLESFIVEELGGVIGEEYATVRRSITFTDGEIPSADVGKNNGSSKTDVIFFRATAISATVLIAAFITVTLIIRRKSKTK